MWQTGRPRTLYERRRISEGLKKHYSEYTPFVRVRNHLEYQDPYNYERKIASLLKHIEVAKIPTCNKKKLLEFQEELRLTTKPGYVYHTVRTLFCMLSDYKKSFRGFSEAEANYVYRVVQRSGLSDYTKSDRIHKLKLFIKWLHNGKAPGWFGKLKTRKKPKTEKYVSLEDVKSFLGVCESDEERAFFSLLWEGGFAVCELLNVRRKDVTVRPECLEIYVESKGRDRSTPILRRKGKMFPLGGYKCFLKHLGRLNLEPEDRIWSMVAYNQVQYRVRKIKGKVDLYHLRTHSFRKSRATYNDEHGMSYAQNCVFGGWHIGSRTLQHYILTSGRTLIPTLQELNRL